MPEHTGCLFIVYKVKPILVEGNLGSECAALVGNRSPLSIENDLTAYALKRGNGSTCELCIGVPTAEEVALSVSGSYDSGNFTGLEGNNNILGYSVVELVGNNEGIYTEALEDKIEDFLKNVDGINEAKVILTLDTSNESVYAQSSSGLDYILTSDGKPISVTEIYPTVRGVAIACTGGERDDIKIKVTELIGAYLGISSNRIKIVGID